ncbi:hypothetical protein C8A03DRAFT_47716 [Achaetomium macrosporum]|uniref:N-acetyltransferase domain-containing protein n=1 Tax=Achaetomium macrosporum TaxID=79813 RepID=A0AAN7C1Z9_9PEZI|nr:hypothetical protein C8A03DRAFT_47716 [Achaetomium macrosporum]
MTMTPRILLEDTPTPSNALLSLLKSHLPHSLPVLRCLQFARNFPNYRSPQAHIRQQEQQFAAAYVDLSRGPETQIWLYSTLEDRCAAVTTTISTSGVVNGEGARAGVGSHGGSDYTPGEEEKALDLVLVLLRRARALGTACDHQLLIPAAAGGLEGRQIKVLIGSLHEDIRQRLLARGVRMEKSPNIPAELEWEFCGKWLFRVEDLPPSNGSLPEGMRWDRVRREDVRLVLDRTSIKRKEATLLMLPSTAIRMDDGTPIAWVFMVLGLDGSIVTLHVEEPYRRLGLAKAVACKLMREHLRDYGDDGWGAADVFEGNLASQGFCRSIGGKLSSTISWATMDLCSVGDPM